MRRFSIGDATSDGELELYLSFIDVIFSLDHQTGIKFSERLLSLIDYLNLFKTVDEYGRMVNKQDFVMIYGSAVRFLLNKTKSRHLQECHLQEYEPKGLLAEILDPKINYDRFIKYFMNSIFIHYLYEECLPVYSFSITSGKEMMRAVTTGDYKKGYDAEKRLIRRVVRDIGERYE